MSILKDHLDFVRQEVRAQIREHGDSQRTFAEAIGISASTLNDFLCENARRPHSSTIRSIVEAPIWPLEIRRKFLKLKRYYPAISISDSDPNTERAEIFQISAPCTLGSVASAQYTFGMSFPIDDLDLHKKIG